MVTIPEIYGISDLRTRQGEILGKLTEGPVVVTHHARAAAVLVSPDMWNEMVQRVEDLDDALAALEVKLRLQSGEESLGDWDSFATETDGLSDTDC